MTWVLSNLPLIGAYLLVHLAQALPAIGLTLVLAIPLARLAQQLPWLRAPLVTGSALLYAVPSLALFIILPLILGTSIRDPLNVVAALTLYGLALLVPATVEALESVDARVIDSATAVGTGRMHRFVAVELPLAGPAILAGLRVVAVSTISLTTVGAVLGVRSLGFLFTDGFQRGLTAQIVTGILVTALVALVLDGLLVAGGLLVMPWTRPAASPRRNGRPGEPETPEPPRPATVTTTASGREGGA